jgi:hypothetical protein
VVSVTITSFGNLSHFERKSWRFSWKTMLRLFSVHFQYFEFLVKLFTKSQHRPQGYEPCFQSWRKKSHSLFFVSSHLLSSAVQVLLANSSENHPLMIHGSVSKFQLGYEPTTGHFSVSSQARTLILTVLHIFYFFFKKSYHPIPRRDSISRPIITQAETIPLCRPRRKVIKFYTYWSTCHGKIFVQLKMSMDQLFSLIVIASVRQNQDPNPGPSWMFKQPWIMPDTSSKISTTGSSDLPTPKVSLLTIPGYAN